MRDTQQWKIKRLTDLAEYLNGYAFKPDDWGKEGLPIIRIEQLKNPESISDYYSGRIGEKNIIHDGDLIFSWSASLFLRIWQNGKAALNQHLFKVVEKDGIDRTFLKQFIEYYLPEITKASHGSTMQHITRKELDRFGAEFPINKPEQSKIAEILSTVDRAIEQTEGLIAKQQRTKTGLMQDILTRGIDEHGNLRSEETHEFKDSPVGRIPVEWEVDKLENIAEFVTSGSRGWARYYSAEGALFLRIGNLTRDHINMRFDDVVWVNPPQTSEGKRTSVVTGDLLISITADLGMIAVIPERFGEAYVNQHIALVRLNNSEVAPRFIGWFLSGYRGQSQFDKLNESGAKAGLNLPTIKNLLVPTTSLTEQESIVKVLEANIQVSTDYRHNFKKLRYLKTALMQDLLTGKVRVTPLLAKQEVQ
jgi:type I restriction enzyme S subunit